MTLAEISNTVKQHQRFYNTRSYNAYYFNSNGILCMWDNYNNVWSYSPSRQDLTSNDWYI